MKLKFEIDIDANIDTVWKAFDDAEGLRRWQAGLRSRRQLSGTPGQPGAIAELEYGENGRAVTLTETVTENRAPDFRAAIYESPRGSTIVVSHFRSLDDRTTRWTSWANFRFRGVMKLMSIFTAGAIRRRTEDDMHRFKMMVETDTSGSAG